MVTVYSQPGCMPCKATVRFLNMNEIPHKVIDVREDAEAAQFVQELGYQQTPVVVFGEDHWSGHQPTRLEKVRQS